MLIAVVSALALYHPLSVATHTCAAETSTITGPMTLKSYYAVSSYKDKKSLFSFNEGDVVQLMQKDPSGWPSIEYHMCVYSLPIGNVKKPTFWSKMG